MKYEQGFNRLHMGELYKWRGIKGNDLYDDFFGQ